MPLHQGQQCHHTDGKDTCTLMMITTPLQQGQQHQLDYGNIAIQTRATTPSWIKGNDTILQGQCLQLDNGKDACASTMATMP
jgi:hypothetical protein